MQVCVKVLISPILSYAGGISLANDHSLEGWLELKGQFSIMPEQKSLSNHLIVNII